jgi:hypothetical protein
LRVVIKPQEPEPPRICRDELLAMLKDNERKPWTNAEYNEGYHDALEIAYVAFGGTPKYRGYLEETQ